LDGQRDEEVVKKQEKWLENDLVARATPLHNMKEYHSSFLITRNSKMYDKSFRS